MQGHNQPNSLELGQAAAASLQSLVCYAYMKVTVAQPSEGMGQCGSSRWKAMSLGKGEHWL